VPDFLFIPAVFYLVVSAARLDLETLRAQGWIFDIGTSREAWYKFYTYFGVSLCAFLFFSLLVLICMLRFPSCALSSADLDFSDPTCAVRVWTDLGRR
jgi:hypothetical protein